MRFENRGKISTEQNYIIILLVLLFALFMFGMIFDDTKVDPAKVEVVDPTSSDGLDGDEEIYYTE